MHVVRDASIKEICRIGRYRVVRRPQGDVDVWVVINRDSEEVGRGTKEAEAIAIAAIRTVAEGEKIASIQHLIDELGVLKEGLDFLNTTEAIIRGDGAIR